MKRSSSQNISRRRFIGEASCASVGSAAMMSSLLSLRMTGSLAAASEPLEGDYKALVCVFLAGGNDSFNMLAPVDETGYAEYEAAREGVALPVEDFTSLGVNLPDPDGRTLGLHSEMPELHSLFTAGKAAFVSNVGTLVERTTAADIQAGTANLPLGLFSHSDQQSHWQSGLPLDRLALNGWGGRMADLIDDLNGISKVSMNVSLAGLNLFQSGVETTVLSRTADGIPAIQDWDHPSFLQRRVAMETMLDAEYKNAFERTFAGAKKGAIETAAEYKVALESEDPLVTEFNVDYNNADPSDPNRNDLYNKLSRQLKAVAETISARESLCKRRQTFFVELGGWDHHGGLDGHPDMLGMVSQAIGEFQAAMVELDLEDEVTLFTASDFSRTLSSNGGGTDHAWGGNQIVVGGAVNGGQIYGEYPELALGGSLDTGRGRFVPTTSVDEYVAELALWMGVSPGNLHLVLPNIGEFHNVVENGPPLGYMSVAP